MSVGQTLWPIVELDKLITDMQPGFAQRPQPDDDGVPQLRPNNVSSSGTIDLSEIKYVRPSQAELRKYLVRRGDVIFNNTNSPDLVGRAAYFDIDMQFVLSNHMTRLRVNEQLLNAEYLARYLHYLWQTGASIRWAKQWVSQAAIDQLALARFLIPLPPLPEQRRIVAILRKADELRQLRRRANERAKDLLPALFYEMFGDPIANKSSWPEKPLNQFGKVTTGNTPPRSHSEYYGDYVEWIKSDNLNTITGIVGPAVEYLSEEGAKRGRLVPEGSTLIACIAGSFDSIGKTGITDRLVAFNQQINAITPFDGTNPYYLFAAVSLSKSRIQAKATKGMKKIVNKSRLESVLIIDPPKDMQDRFAEKWLTYIHIIQCQEKTNTQLDNLFQSLLSRAFTGELTAAWREAYAEEVAEAAAERDRLLGIEKEQQPQQLQIVIAPTDVSRSLGNLSAVVDEIARSQQALLKQMVKVPKLNLPNFTTFANSLRPALAQADIVNNAIKTQITAMAAIDTSALESMARASQPLADVMRSQQAYYADLLEKLAQVARMELDEPPTRSEIETEVLETAAELPAYFTLHDLANDWRLNHFSVHAIEEAVDMLVVRGRLRPATLKLETDDPERPYDLVHAYAVVSDAELVSAQEIEL